VSEQIGYLFVGLSGPTTMEEATRVKAALEKRCPDLDVIVIDQTSAIVYVPKLVEPTVEPQIGGVDE
jgi:hypothetical protein